LGKTTRFSCTPTAALVGEVGERLDKNKGKLRNAFETGSSLRDNKGASKEPDQCSNRQDRGDAVNQSVGSGRLALRRKKKKAKFVQRSDGLVQKLVAVKVFMPELEAARHLQPSPS